MNTGLYNGMGSRSPNVPRYCFRRVGCLFIASSAFTLMEMLVIIGIISMMLAVGLPAFNGMMKSSGRRAAINQTLGICDQARSIAIAEGRPTYVAFADSTFPMPDHWHRAAAIYQDAEVSGASPVLLTTWSLLPTGYSFDCTMVPSIYSAKDPNNTRFPVMGQSKPLPYIKFGPTGSVLYPNNDPSLARIFLFNGYTVRGAAQITTDAVQRGTTAAFANSSEQIKLSLSTGRPKYIPGASDSTNSNP